MSSEVVVATNKNEVVEPETIKLKEAIENNDLVAIWENSEEYEKLAETTVKTMQYINDEQIKEFTKKLTETNEKILNLTFEGVKKHNDKKTEKIKHLHKNQLITYTILAFLAGIFVTVMFNHFTTN